jgi:hypothetical protein
MELHLKGIGACTSLLQHGISYCDKDIVKVHSLKFTLWIDIYLTLFLGEKIRDIFTGNKFDAKSLVLKM